MSDTQTPEWYENEIKGLKNQLEIATVELNAYKEQLDSARLEQRESRLNENELKSLREINLALGTGYRELRDGLALHLWKDVYVASLSLLSDHPTVINPPRDIADVAVADFKKRYPDIA